MPTTSVLTDSPLLEGMIEQKPHELLRLTLLPVIPSFELSLSNLEPPGSKQNFFSEKAESTLFLLSF